MFDADKMTIPTEETRHHEVASASLAPRTRRVGLTLLTVLVTGCFFGATRDIVDHDTVEIASALAMNADRDALFAAELFEGLVVVDPTTGEELARRSLSAYWEVKSLAEDQSDTDTAWALHASGYLLQWNPELSWVSFVSPRPLAWGEDRTYCSLDMDAGGNFYVTSVEPVGGVDTAVLARFDIDTKVWSTVEIAASECVPLGHDEIAHEVVVYLPSTYELVRFDEDLVHIGTTDVDEAVSFATFNDIDVLAGTVMAGGTSYETDVHSALWTIDLATGELLDEEASDLSFINAIQFVDYEDGTMELLEGGMGGLVTIGGVALSL